VLVRLKDREITREEAIQTLGGSAETGAICRLYASRPDWLASPEMKERACYLLMACGSDGVAGLTVLARHTDARIRGTALDCIGEIGRDAASAIVPILRSCERYGEAQVLMAAIPLLRIGPASEAELPHLLTLSHSSKPRVRLLALYEIGRIQPGTKATRSRLREAASDESPLIRERISAVLACIDGNAAESKKVLTALTADGNEAVRQAARKALEKIKAAQEKAKEGKQPAEEPGPGAVPERAVPDQAGEAR
jgi:HEAT repeat protein